MNNNNRKENALEQNKEYNIVVNGKEKTFPEKFITFKQVVELAFTTMKEDGKTIYTVTYYKGNNNKPKGSMVAGEKVRVKEGMVFNVTQTIKS